MTFKPAVTKRVLLFSAGLAWSGVGLVLLRNSWLWLSETSPDRLILYGGLGILLSLFVHHFGFLKVVDKNIARILPMVNKRCLFSFITWKSYIIIVVMILMGMLLRRSDIPKVWLAVLNTGIGLALILSSLRYFRVFFKRCISQV